MELKHYLKVIRKRAWLIMALVVMAVLAAGIKSMFYTTPIYQASAKLLVNQATAEGGLKPDMNSVQTNIMLINSYKEIALSGAILNKVVAQYPELEVTARQIAGGMTISSANQSQVMDLVYRDTSAERAVRIVNAVSEVFKEEIPTIMQIDNVTILNEAMMEEAGTSINASPVTTVVVAFAASLVLALGLVFLLDYMDNTFKSEKELEEVLGIPILAVVSKIRKGDLSTPGPVVKNKAQGVGEGKYASLS